jgi:hypothetical protein
VNPASFKKLQGASAGEIRARPARRTARTEPPKRSDGGSRIPDHRARRRRVLEHRERHRPTTLHSRRRTNSPGCPPTRRSSGAS